MATKKTTPEERLEREPHDKMPLLSPNFKLMAAAGIVIVLGFLLMAGGATADTFNADIFSTRRIVVGPTIAFLGFLFMGFAIMYSPRTKKKD